MSLLRYKRMPSNHALDWSWFFQQIDMLSAAIDEPDETSIDTVERADFQSETFLRVDDVFKNAVSVKTDILLRKAESRSHEPSPAQMRFTAVEIVCKKYTIANIAYRVRTPLKGLVSDMIYCCVAVGNRQLVELSSISQPKINPLNDSDELILHNHDFSNSGFVELLEGVNKVYFLLYWPDTSTSWGAGGAVETHQELTISEMR